MAAAQVVLGLSPPDPTESISPPRATENAITAFCGDKRLFLAWGSDGDRQRLRTMAFDNWQAAPAEFTEVDKLWATLRGGVGITIVCDDTFAQIRAFELIHIGSRQMKSVSFTISGKKIYLSSSK